MAYPSAHVRHFARCQWRKRESCSRVHAPCHYKIHARDLFTSAIGRQECRAAAPGRSHPLRRGCRFPAGCHGRNCMKGLIVSEFMERYGATNSPANLAKLLILWWAQQDSNLRLPPCEGGTLPLSYAPQSRSLKAQKAQRSKLLVKNNITVRRLSNLRLAHANVAER